MYKFESEHPEPIKEEKLFKALANHEHISFDKLADYCCKLIDIYIGKNEEITQNIFLLLDNYKEVPLSGKCYLIYKILICNPNISDSQKREIKDKIKDLEYKKIDKEVDTIAKRTNIKRLSVYIKNLRSINKLSTEKLAKLSGVSAALINKIENCRMQNMPKHSTLYKLANALGVNITEITGEYETKEKTTTSYEDFKLLLINLGYKPKFVNQILDYADTIMLKQKIEEGKINV